MCDSVNHTRFPKEDRLPDWARRDNKVTKGGRVDLDTHRTERNELILQSWEQKKYRTDVGT